jgi:hypothetical protein
LLAGGGALERLAVTAGAWRTHPPTPTHAELAARQLLRRYGVVVRKAPLREKLPVRWRNLRGILTPGERVAPTVRAMVAVW